MIKNVSKALEVTDCRVCWHPWVFSMQGQVHDAWETRREKCAEEREEG